MKMKRYRRTARFLHMSMRMYSMRMRLLIKLAVNTAASYLHS
jgi:hypothetical protein